MPVCPVCGGADSGLAVYDNHTPPAGPRDRLRRALRAVLQALPPGVPLPGSWAGQAGSPFRGAVRICHTCGHAVMDCPPDLDSLKRYYGRQYWSERPRPDGRELQRGRARAEAQVGLLCGLRRSAGLPDLPVRSLEIGAAWAGATLRLRELAGEAISTAVCEPGEHWSAHYEANRIERVAGYYPFRSERRFDHIHTSHWLEHVLDLDATRRALVDQLEPGGTLFIEVPNCEAPYWTLPLMDSPHIHFFTRESLVRCFTDAGLQCLGCERFGISLEQRVGGVPSTSHEGNPRGIWLRAVFHKPS